MVQFGILIKDRVEERGNLRSHTGRLDLSGRAVGDEFLDGYAAFGSHFPESSGNLVGQFNCDSLVHVREYSAANE